MGRGARSGETLSQVRDHDPNLFISLIALRGMATNLRRWRSKVSKNRKSKLNMIILKIGGKLGESYFHSFKISDITL